jgi:hypothetical protein
LEKRIHCSQWSPSSPNLREHAYRLYRDKLPDYLLTLENWVLAEKDLVNSMEAEEDGVAV